MKLLRHGPPGLERPGLLDEAGQVRDLSAHVHDIAGSALAPASLQRLAAVDRARLPVVPAGTRLGPCVGKVGKVVMVEPGNLPRLWLLAPTALSGAADPVRAPAGLAVSVHTRLAMVIGQRTSAADAADTAVAVAGFALLGEARPVEPAQADRRHLDSFAPMGPWLVTTGDPAIDVTAALVYASACMTLEPGDVVAVPLPPGLTIDELGTPPQP